SDRFVKSLLNSERVTECRIGKRDLRPAGERRPIITAGFERRGSNERIPKADVCPEVGGVLALHPFQESLRSAMSDSNPLSQRQEQRARLIRHGNVIGQL